MPPRWFVEVSPLDTHAVKERYCVEAAEWQQALVTARSLRGEQGPLSNFSIEVTDSGYRAVDPAVRLRYVVDRAPDDAPLSEATEVEPPSIPPSEPTSVGKALAESIGQDESDAAPSTAPIHKPIEPPPTLVGTRLVYSRADEPTETVPIAYREYAYAVAPWSTADELRTLLSELFERATRAMASRPPGKYIQLALFDHVFEEQPERPPLATLAWKDWRGQPVVTVTAKKPDAAAPTRQDPAFITRPVPLKKPHASSDEPSPTHAAGPPEPESSAAAPRPSPAPAARPAEPESPAPSDEPSPGSPEPEPPPSDAPSPPPRQGDEAIPKGAEKPADAEPPPESLPPPSHQERRRHQPDDDLITELFEPMGELHFMTDLIGGVEHVLVLLWETIPCEGTLIHIYDPDHDAFVVVRAAGPHPNRALMHRTEMSHPLLSEAFDTGGSVRVDHAASDPRFQGDRWKKLGVEPRHGLCGAVQHDGRPLAAIELVNPITEAPFFENERNALEYVCEQLAHFVEKIPVVIDDATVMPRA